MVVSKSATSIVTVFKIVGGKNVAVKPVFCNGQSKRVRHTPLKKIKRARFHNERGRGRTSQSDILIIHNCKPINFLSQFTATCDLL